MADDPVLVEMVSGLAMGQEDLVALHHHEFGHQIAQAPTRRDVQELDFHAMTSLPWVETLASRASPAARRVAERACQGYRFSIWAWHNYRHSTLSALDPVSPIARIHDS